MARLPLAAVVCVFLAGCVQGAAPAQVTGSPPAAPLTPTTDVQVAPLRSFPLESIDELRFGKGGFASLRLNGTGYGILSIQSDDDLEIEVELTNDHISDLGTFSRDGEGIYDEKNYTVVLGIPAGARPWTLDSYFFSWWGTPKWSVWPFGSSTFDVTSFAVDAGQASVLVVATTVRGYTINLTAGSGDQPSPLPYDWTLAPSKDVHVEVPTVKETSVANVGAARVQRERKWDAQLRDAPAIALVEEKWTYVLPTTVKAGIRSDSLGFSEGAATASQPLPGPAYSIVAAGGYSYSAGTSYSSTTKRNDRIDLWRHLSESDVGVDASQEGAAFLAIPWKLP